MSLLNDSNNCILCGTSFAPRKGKQYCSDSCKTKAYNLRKEGKEISGDQMRPKSSTLIFYIDEYEQWKESEKEFNLSLDAYCFFRKNLPNNIDVPGINKLLKSYYELNYINDLGNITSDHNNLLPSFHSFQKLFFEGGFRVENSK